MMPNNISNKPFGEEKRPYEVERPIKRKRRYIFIGLGVLVAFGMGSCVMVFANLFQMASERQDATLDFINSVQENGLPDADSNTWSDLTSVTEESLSDLNQMMSHFGQAEQVGEPNCSAHTRTSTDGPNGTFVACTTPMTYNHTAGKIDITWRKESEDWKIYRFYSGYDDVSTYHEAQARAKVEAEMAED